MVYFERQSRLQTLVIQFFFSFSCNAVGTNLCPTYEFYQIKM